MQHLVLVGHEKNVGKDTFANIFVTNLRLKGVDVTRRGFADRIKSQAASLFGYLGVKSKEYYDSHYDERDIPLPCGKSPRQIWIELGNKVREVDDRVWFEAARTKALVTVIPDFRYPNEGYYADLTENLKVHKIKINGRVAARTVDKADEALRNYHGWDHELDNRRTIPEFAELVNAFANEFYETLE